MTRAGILTFEGIPLHAVLASHLSEVLLDNVGQGGVAQVIMVDLSTKVSLSLGAELAVQTSCTTTSTGWLRCAASG